MAKVIKRNIKQRKCENCGDTIEYHESEVREYNQPGSIFGIEYCKFIVCPSCNKDINWDVR